MTRILLIATCCLLGLGCSTVPAIQAFEQIKPGMEKTDVIEVMGSPQRTQRWHGMDRWTYIMYENASTPSRQEKEIHFSEGKAVYVGLPPVPKISADEQDRINEASNRAAAQAAAARAAEAKQTYQRMESESTGMEEIRYVPKFEPIE